MIVSLLVREKVIHISQFLGNVSLLFLSENVRFSITDTTLLRTSIVLEVPFYTSLLIAFLQTTSKMLPRYNRVTLNTSYFVIRPRYNNLLFLKIT